MIGTLLKHVCDTYVTGLRVNCNACSLIYKLVRVLFLSYLESICNTYQTCLRCTCYKYLRCLQVTTNTLSILIILTVNVCIIFCSIAQLDCPKWITDLNCFAALQHSVLSERILKTSALVANVYDNPEEVDPKYIMCRRSFICNAIKLANVATVFLL